METESARDSESKRPLSNEVANRKMGTAVTHNIDHSRYSMTISKVYFRDFITVEEIYTHQNILVAKQQSK